MPEETRYLVNISATTAILAVVGKANYLNCHAVSDFFAKAIERGCTKIIVECSRCNGMDSTFLGMIAGAALTLRKSEGVSFSIPANFFFSAAVRAGRSSEAKKVS